MLKYISLVITSTRHHRYSMQHKSSIDAIWFEMSFGMSDIFAAAPHCGVALTCQPVVYRFIRNTSPKKKKSSCYLQTLASRAEFSYLNYVKASQWCGAVGSEKPCCYLRKHAKIGLYCLMRLCSCHVLPWQTNKAQTAAQIALSEQPLRLSGQESSWNEGRFR